jgi:hypothetical protein
MVESLPGLVRARMIEELVVHAPALGGTPLIGGIILD